jgi:hypothetical protein
MTRLVLVMVLCAFDAPLFAEQWLKEPTRGMPRTSDGKPDLSAPAPRTADGKPDLSGLWRNDSGAYGGNIVADLSPADIQPWADALYKQRFENLGKDDPATFTCLPQGPRAMLGGAGWARIIQTPMVTAVLFENFNQRQIFTDGRALPAEPNPSFMGYSVGRWEGDTFVIESHGFNDRTWLDFGGHPHTEELRITERLRRRDFGHIEMQVTFSDPKVYAKSWTIDVKMEFVPDTEMLEYVCNENERSYARMIGKASDDKKNAITLPVQVLDRYVGAYEFRSTEDPNFVMVLNVTRTGGELFIDLAGKDKQPMTPLAETLFSAVGGRIEFVADEKGGVTHALFRAVEGDMKGVRK